MEKGKRERTNGHAKVKEVKSKKKRLVDVTLSGHSPRLPLPAGAARLAFATTAEETKPAFPGGRPRPASAEARHAPVGAAKAAGLQLPGCRARGRLRSAAGGGGLFSAEEERGRGGRQRVRVQSSAAAARAHDSHMPCSFFHLW